MNPILDTFLSVCIRGRTHAYKESSWLLDGKLKEVKKAILHTPYKLADMYILKLMSQRCADWKFKVKVN